MANHPTSFDFDALASAIQLLDEHLAAQAGRVDVRELRRYRLLYQTYPQIRESVTPELRNTLGNNELRSLSKKRESVTPEFAVDGRTLVSRLSFTHLVELLTLEAPIQRAFYEIECIRGNWSVRELRRQIASLYYERSGLSKDKDRLAELVKSAAEQAEPRLAIRDPFVFEFLGLVVSQEHDARWRQPAYWAAAMHGQGSCARRIRACRHG